MTKLQKLGGMLNKCYFDGKMPKCATMADIAVLQCCYNALAKKQRPELVSLSAKNILENMGFTVVPKGIGWIVLP